MPPIAIDYSDLILRPKYLHCPKTGKYDILGQILFSLGYDIPIKARLVADLEQHIDHFTRCIRGQLLDSPLSQDILMASQVHHPKHLLDKVNNLFTLYKAPYQIKWA